MTSLILQTGRLQFLPSLQTLKKITSWSNTWNVSSNHNKSNTLTISLQKDRTGNPFPLPLINILTILFKKFTFKLLGLTISYDCSWANHISKLVSKASC